MPSLICDFCSDSTPSYEYPAESFSLLTDQVNSIGNWAACEECSGLIEAGDYDSLSALSFVKAQANIPMNMEAAAEFYEYLKRLHAKFREHRNGERRRIDN